MHYSRCFTFETVNPSNPPTEPMPDALGIEMTEPAIARLCGLGNIDPQHGPDSTPDSPAAIEACLDEPLPPEGARLLTIRPDLDSIGAMAVFLLRARGIEPSAILDIRKRISRIADVDRFAQGPWPGRRGLPHSVEEILEDGIDPDLAAMTVCVFERELQMAVKVERIADWLETGKVPGIYQRRATRPAEQLFQSMIEGKTDFSTHHYHGHAIASVVSTGLLALRQAYRLAPVVVALNPEFKFPSGKRGKKFTIARWDETHAELDIVAKHIARLEDGWGGQPGIKGSPQAHPSELEIEQVIECLSHGLPNAPKVPLSEETVPKETVPKESSQEDPSSEI